MLANPCRQVVKDACVGVCHYVSRRIRRGILDGEFVAASGEDAAVKSPIRTLRAVRCREFFLHVALPIAFGAMVYLMFRTTSLLVFDWLEAVGLLPATLAARRFCSGVRLPDWFLFCLPDGLWVYAATSWMILIWARKPPLPWLLIGVALGVGGELGQLVGMVSGTYQHWDMVFYLLGFLTACLATGDRRCK